MELPKNITQIGETNPHCKVYVEDYVISYIKQLNQNAGEKELAVALYGIRKEEAGVTYLFLYGACRLVFLQKECRHLSQAVLQEAEKQRKKFFPDTVFLGYRLLDGEMVEGFHICEQGVCRYVEGYAQFYEKNDAMLAFMLEERQEASKPETVDQEKYNVVKKRQEERRALAEEKSGSVLLPRFKKTQKASPAPTPVNEKGRIRGMKLTAAAVFALLCMTGLAAMGNGGRLEGWQAAFRQIVENMSEKQLPDAVQVSNGSAQVGTIVAEDKLTDAILHENAAAGSDTNVSGTGQGAGEGALGTEEGNQPVGQEQGQENGQAASQNPGQGTAQGDTIQDPGQETGQAAPQDPNQSGTTQNPTQEAGQAASQNPDQGTAQGDTSQNSGQGSNPGDAAQNPGQGTDQGDTSQNPGQGSNQGDTAQNPGQGTTQGDTAKNPDQGTVQGDATQDPDQETDKQPESRPAAGPTAELVSYTVQRGDTLIGICTKRYGSDARVSEICSLNNIENPDDIKVGEKIFLPQ